MNADELKVMPGHTREDYEACLRYAAERGYWAMFNAMAEGYDPTVDWRSLIKDECPEEEKCTTRKQ